MILKENLYKAIKRFDTSYRTSDDYLDLFIVSNNVLKQGNGLLWSDVVSVINDVLEEENDEITKKL